MNWDDLRIAVAVHKSGSYAGASARLKIDETTVARRIARLQRDLGVPLFEAVDGVRTPTAQCTQILSHIEHIAGHVAQIATVNEAAKGLVGRFRIAATDSVSAELLAPRAPAFLADNPNLTLQFLASTENVNFSRWEADIAVRLAKPDKGDFIISKLGEIRFFLVEPATKPVPDAADLVCAYPDDLEGTPESQYLAELGRLASARCITKNLLVIRSLIRSGTASGILPDFMCAEFLDDDRTRLTELNHKREAWLLVQQHLKHDPAARAVIDWIKECFATISR